MSLYRYVAAKDELLALMVDAALGAPPPRTARARLARRPVALGVGLPRRAAPPPVGAARPDRGPPVTPNLTAWLEDGLRSLGRHRRCRRREKLSVMLLLSGYVRNEATLAADHRRGARAARSCRRWGRLLARLTDAGGLPGPARRARLEAFAQDDEPDDEFVFGLERVLDGIGSLVSGKD